MSTVELAFDEFGRGKDETIIILHGFFASSRNWRKIGEKLAESYHVYVPDARNHGASPHHLVMNYPAMAEDILRFMDHHSVHKTHIIGHSMGGKTAMWLALNDSIKVNKLVVADIAPKSYDHSFDKIIQALVNLPLARLTNRKIAETLLAETIPQLEYRQFLLQNLVLEKGKYRWRINLSIYRNTAQHIAAFPDEAVKLPPFQGNVLFLAGSESNYVNPEDVQALFPASMFKTITGAGHWLHVQKPDVFLQEVENFLQTG